MKTLVVVASGAADRPLEELGGRTPLEAAATPMLDRLAHEGRLGRLTPAPIDARPEEGSFALGLFGLDAVSYGDIGAVLDAAAFDVPVGSLDQAFRLALVTADEHTIFDPTAGFIPKDEAALLLSSLTETLADPNLSFHPGDGWRNLLLWKGARDVRLSTVPPFEVVGKNLRAALPRGTGIGRLLAGIERSRETLVRHEVNELRADLGENPATMVWPWGGGVTVPLPDFKARTGIAAVVIGVNPTVLGAARLQGIRTIRPDGATGRPDTSLRSKTEAALESLETSDFVLLHLDAPAAASHARDFVSKVESLERIDGYVVGRVLREIASGLECRLVFLGGEAVSAESGRFLRDPVPFAIYGAGVRSHGRTAFSEVTARDAGFDIERTHELTEFLLHLPD